MLKSCTALYVLIELVHFVIRIGGMKRESSFEYREALFELFRIHASRSLLDAANSNSAMGFLGDFQIFIVGISTGECLASGVC